MHEAMAMLMAKIVAVSVDEATARAMAAVKKVIEATREGAWCQRWAKATTRNPSSNPPRWLLMTADFSVSFAS